MTAVDNDEISVDVDKATDPIDAAAGIDQLVVVTPEVGHRELPQSLGLVAHLWSTPRGVRQLDPDSSVSAPLPAPRKPADD